MVNERCPVLPPLRQGGGAFRLTKPRIQWGPVDVQGPEARLGSKVEHYKRPYRNGERGKQGRGDKIEFAP